MLLKHCSKCHCDKPEDEFRWAVKDVRRAVWCKPCFSEHEKQYYRNSQSRRDSTNARNAQRREDGRKLVFEYLSQNPCTDCGITDPIVLEFDHRDGTDKRGNLADMAARGLATSTLRAEIAKCDVRCANCHRRRTALQQGWYASMRGDS